MDELVKWASRNPDRWAHAVEVFAKLQGFTEKREPTQVNVFHMLANASDADVRAKLQELEYEEGLLLEARNKKRSPNEQPTDNAPPQLPTWTTEEA